MANTSIRKTFSGNGNTKKWTLSWWEKKNKLGTVQRIFSCDESGNNNHDDFFQWQTDDKLVIGFYDSGYYMNLTPDRNFRDTNAWYHFVFTWDTAQATASNRAKFYVNGVQETVFATETYPSQNKDSFINTTEPIEIGKRSDNDTQFLESTLSHVHFCDGYAYAASDFGSTDATTGEWKINTSPSVSYGTNGFWILKDGNTITDSSPNSNDWSSVSGTLTKTEDCPSNVFCTINPLTNNQPSNFVLSHGNTKATVNGQWLSGSATMGMITGKYYWELKRGSGNYGLGVVLANGVADNITQHSYQNYAFCSRYVDGWEFFHNGSAKRQNNNSQSDWGSTLNSGDIMTMAFDADTGKLYAGKNGTWFESGNPATGAYPMYTLTTGKFYIPCLSVENGNHEINFGNGYFGSTQISSAGTNASGNGIFEYDVPNGFTALSTKGLNL